MLSTCEHCLSDIVVCYEKGNSIVYSCCLLFEGSTVFQMDLFGGLTCVFVIHLLTGDSLCFWHIIVLVISINESLVFIAR